MSGRTFGMQSLRLVGRPWKGVALRLWPGPEVLLSLLPEMWIIPKTNPKQPKKLNDFLSS
jgi:hypothetical protein